MYYDRDGNRVSHNEWSKLFTDEQYRRVGSTTVHGRWWVSTVWLGLDHSPMSQLPMTFETCIFDHPTSFSEDEVTSGGVAESWVARRYPTWNAAKRGHRAIVKQLREGVMPSDI
jgi:hypothetical protein